MRRLLIFLSMFFLASAQADSDRLLQSLNYSGHVNDFAGVMSASDRSATERLLTELEQKTGAKVAVVTLKSLDGGQIDDFTLRLAERWKVGQKGKDNGVLLLGATQEGRGNRLRIEVGYGLEGVITDAAAGRLLDQNVVPKWNQQQFGSAMAAGGMAIAQRIAADKGIRLSGVPQQAYTRGYDPRMQRKSNPFVSLLFMIGFIYMAIRHPRLLLLMLVMGGRGGRGGGFGGGGFGGGGFGGGGFGGGGASR